MSDFLLACIGTLSETAPVTHTPIMKKISYFLACLILLSSLPAEAQNRRNRNGAAQRAMAEKRKQEAAEKAKRDKINQAIDDFLKDHDRNKDKSVTLEEFTSASSNAKEAEQKFKQFNKNNDRYLSKKEIQELLGL
jgi:membrane protein involved in colicin uptake